MFIYINIIIIHNLEIYFENNIKNIIKEWRSYSSKTSNEIELGDNEFNYKLYFYYYSPKNKTLYIRDGCRGEEKYDEHNQLLDSFAEFFGKGFLCLDLINEKMYTR